MASGAAAGAWGFHPEGVGRHKTPALNRAEQEERVCSGRAHAALVFDGEECVGWCQFGSPGELPRIKFRRAYDAEPGAPPDWRITCFFVDSKHRRQGVSDAALGGALELIAGLGGGVVESSPELIAGRKVSASFLHNASVELFERHGFERIRRLGKHHWLVSRTV